MIEHGRMGERGFLLIGREGDGENRRCRLWRCWCLGTVVLMLWTGGFGATDLYGQGRIPSKVGPVTLSGNVGFSSEVYGTRGVPARRSAFSSQLTAGISAQAYRFSYGLDLVLSTEKSRFGQSFNRAGLDIAYRWIKVAGGSITPTFSKYSLKGLTYEGGLVELTPGSFLLSLTAGRPQEAIEPTTEETFLQPAYEQWLYAVRLGVGEENGPHFHFVGLYARDDTTSIQARDNIAPPTENLSVSPDFGFSLFNGAFKLRGLGTVSAFTRDLGGEAIDFEEAGNPIPEWLLDLYRPNFTTNIDYAGEIDARVVLPFINLRGGYERVQPGFESMGLARTRNDYARTKVQSQLNFFKRRLRVSSRFNQSRNNLLGQKTATRTRQQWAFTAQGQVNDVLSLNGGYTLMMNETALSANATTGTPRDQSTQSFSLAPTLNVRAAETTHTISFTGTYQVSRDQAGTTSGTRLTTTNLSTNYTVALPTGLSLNALASYLSTQAQPTQTTAINVNAGANQSFFDRRVSVSLATAFSLTNNETDAVGDMPARSDRIVRQTLNGNVRYRVPFGGSLTLTLRGLHASPANQTSYQELRTVLRYARRF